MMDNRVVHLHALLNRTAVVFKRMDKQRRGNALIRGLQRRLVPDLIHIAPRRGIHLIIAEGEADVGHHVFRDPVGNRTLRSCARKSVRMTDDPVGHVAAVAAAGYAQTARIDLRHAV